MIDMTTPPPVVIDDLPEFDDFLPPAPIAAGIDFPPVAAPAPPAITHYGGNDLYAEYDGIMGRWEVTGATFDYRNSLKSWGFRWQSFPNKLWVFSGQDLPEKFLRLLKPIQPITIIAPAPQPVAPTVNEPDEEEAPAPTINLTVANLPAWFTPPSWWATINIFIQYRPGIAIVGPAGNGKTTTAEMALKAQGIEYLMLSCTDRTEVLDLVGGMMLTASGEKWHDGIVTRAFKEGKALILDEADALDPRVMMSLQNALQDAGPDNSQRFISTPEGRILPTDKCPIILTMNTFGSGADRQYVGRNQLDSASLDRLSFISTTYENEDRILMARGYKSKLSKQIVKWAETTRNRIEANGLRIIVSPRTMLRIAQAITVFGWAFDLAIEIEFLSRVAVKDRAYIA